MEAHNRSLEEWFNRIRSRQITLPRFQRGGDAWGPSEVSGLLTTVLRGLPSGAALTLEVGNEPKFKSRSMNDAPTSGERETEQLLDGQQRLTALWRSLHDKYHNRTYLVTIQEDLVNENEKLPHVHGEARWDKGDIRYPIWVDNPEKCWGRGFIPINLLRPGDINEEIKKWITEAMPDNIDNELEAYTEIFDIINELRNKVRTFNLPYLALPAQTPKEVALDVFIKMNTSSVNLSTYDIVVALVEEETGRSLHDHVEKLKDEVPRVADYVDVTKLVLDVVALRSGRSPSQAVYRGANYYKEMINDWETVVKSIAGMVRFLKAESIFDSQRLPSYTVTPIIAALWEHIPKQPDQRGNALHSLRKFLWRAFLTSRYEQSSATNAFQDFRNLKNVLLGKFSEDKVPIFTYQLPTPDMLLQADWPKRRTILGRGLLALQIRCGADDLADGTRTNEENIKSKEYHHLFPASTLEDAKIPDEKISRALNCALITKRTNRTISNKDPIMYLKERSDNNVLGEEELRRRLKTHLIPYNKLAVGYDGLNDEVRRACVKNDYDKFLGARADILSNAAQQICEGKNLEIRNLFLDRD